MSAGVVYTRTGRRFFTDTAMEAALLDRLRRAVERCGWWDTFATDWLCLDGELLPWSAKAEALLREQYAPVGVAAQVGLAAAVEALTQAAQARCGGRGGARALHGSTAHGPGLCRGLSALLLARHVH